MHTRLLVLAAFGGLAVTALAALRLVGPAEAVPVVHVESERHDARMPRWGAG